MSCWFIGHSWQGLTLVWFGFDGDHTHDSDPRIHHKRGYKVFRQHCGHCGKFQVDVESWPTYCWGKYCWPRDEHGRIVPMDDEVVKRDGAAAYVRAALA